MQINHLIYYLLDLIAIQRVNNQIVSQLFQGWFQLVVAVQAIEKQVLRSPVPQKIQLMRLPLVKLALE
jgi:hypothetical protein